MAQSLPAAGLPPPPQPPAEAGVRRVERDPDARWLAGVCAGLSEHTGIPVWAVRTIFGAAAISGGIGLVAYALMWVFLPLRTRDPNAASPGWDVTGMLGLLALGVGLVLAAAALGIPVRTSVWVPLLLFAGGVAVLWRASDEAQRDPLLDAEAPGPAARAGVLSDRGFWVRTLIGVGLVAAGLITAIGPRVDLLTGLQALAAAGAVAAGLALIALPWVGGWVKRSRAKRYAVIRAQERAAMAARVHDSVLQTLTLIQRRAEDPAEVLRLARAEERALRSWLYTPTAASGTLGSELAAIAQAAETDYGARVEVVVVGDMVVDDRVAAVVAATREAVVNAAKHSGAAISVYAEVSGDGVEVDVRDRGAGFDLQAIPEDRHGVRESIIARVEQAGGVATVRSELGSGTEVRLRLPGGGSNG